jgi:outer membrane protein
MLRCRFWSFLSFQVPDPSEAFHADDVQLRGGHFSGNTDKKGIFMMVESQFRILLFACMCAFSWGIMVGESTAQEASVLPPLTLEQAVKTGLEKNPRMSASQFQLDASAARIKEALSGLYPRIDFNQSFVTTTNPAQAFSIKLNQEQITAQDFDPARLNNPPTTNNFASIFSLSMPLYDAGQIRAGVTQARLGHESATLSADRTRQEVIASVVVAYVGALTAKDQLKDIHQALETAGADEKIIRSRYENGLVVKSDLLRARVRIAGLEQERLTAESQVDVALAVLNAAMGAEIDHAYQLAPLEKRGPGPAGSLEEWLQKARDKRPDLKQLRSQEMIADEGVKRAKLAYLPSLHLTGSYEMDTEDFSNTANNYSVGLLLRFNLFSGFENEWRVHEALANLQQVKALIKQFELGVEVEMRRAFFQTQSAFERIKVAEAAVGQAEESLRIVRNRYENGLFTIVDLLDSETALQQARTQYLRSTHDYTVARAQLYLAAGIMDENFR